MQILMTFREIIDRGIWSDFCTLTGICPDSIRDGKMDNDEEYTLTEEQALRLGVSVSFNGYIYLPRD